MLMLLPRLCLQQPYLMGAVAVKFRYNRSEQLACHTRLRTE
jgi:hypothetical protein